MCRGGGVDFSECTICKGWGGGWEISFFFLKSVKGELSLKKIFGSSQGPASAGGKVLDKEN